jgi:predicted extracellular nuclease
VDSGGSSPAAPVGQANVTVASFNVLNYFTTIDDGLNRARGADSESELTRQEAKLVAAMIALEADVIGLMELENNLAAETRLVAALNQKMGETVFKGCGLPAGFNDVPGGQNAIRVGIIYRSDRVTPVQDVALIRNDAFENARTPIVQKFKPNTAGDPFTVIVNHFKSKGGSQEADASNKDQGDGQGAYNATRRSQSLAICDYIEGLEENARVLVIGDLNAYGQEDPIDAFRANGLVDLQQSLGTSPAGDHYSFMYYGQSGALDHALATPALAGDVTGIATWHINADEPRFLDYNQEYNPETLYEANPFRSSDHDPVLIGIGN